MMRDFPDCPSFSHLRRISEARRRRLMRAADAVPPTRDHAKKPLLQTPSLHSDGEEESSPPHFITVMIE